MQARAYHLQRLKPEDEERIRAILRDGSDKIIDILHQHYKKYLPENNEKFFEDVLIQIATTASLVASLPVLNLSPSKKNRIAFLPGYTTKSGERIAHKVKYDKRFIPSEIAFRIKDVVKIERIKDTPTNQTLLYYYLLETHREDGEFINGGTHQFLIANSTRLKTKSQYHIDLLQTYTGTKTTKAIEEITFLTLMVDFEKHNSVEKLYDFFDKELNVDNPLFRWPLSTEDKEGDYSSKPSTYRMRGYLVALWYKILHDKNKSDIDQWFVECITYAKDNGFKKLEQRLKGLQDKINRDTDEEYCFWYSLAFTPLPDFATPSKSVKETLGSAMLLTNFELRPQFFFWIQPWISRMYRYLRDFENLESRASDFIEELTLSLNRNKKNSEYLPKKVTGGRWVTSDEQQKHLRPLLEYYDDFFSEENKANWGKPDYEAIQMLNNFSLVVWLDQLDKTLASKYDTTRTAAMHKVGSVNQSKKYGRELGELKGNQIISTRTTFAHRIMGRLVTLGCYLFLSFSMQRIHAILISKKAVINEAFSGNDNPFRALRTSFYIEGLKSDDSQDARNLCVGNICDNLSDHERKFLKDWWKQHEVFLRNTLVSEPDLLQVFLERRKSTQTPLL